jgi:hypothetical protein
MLSFYFYSATDDAQRMMQMSGGGGFGFDPSKVPKYSEIIVNFCFCL